MTPIPAPSNDDGDPQPVVSDGRPRMTTTPIPVLSNDDNDYPYVASNGRRPMITNPVPASSNDNSDAGNSIDNHDDDDQPQR